MTGGHGVSTVLPCSQLNQRPRARGLGPARAGALDSVDAAQARQPEACSLAMHYCLSHHNPDHSCHSCHGSQLPRLTAATAHSCHGSQLPHCSHSAVAATKQAHHGTACPGLLLLLREDPALTTRRRLSSNTCTGWLGSPARPPPGPPGAVLSRAEAVQVPTPGGANISAIVNTNSVGNTCTARRDDTMAHSTSP